MNFNICIFAGQQTIHKMGCYVHKNLYINGYAWNNDQQLRVKNVASTKIEVQETYTPRRVHSAYGRATCRSGDTVLTLVPHTVCDFKAA